MLTKIVIGCVGVALFGGTIAGSYIHLTGDHTIEQLLKKENNNRTAITTNNKGEEGWLKKWTDYITENSNSNKPKDKDILGLDDWDTVSKDKSKIPDSFVKKCNDLSKIKIKDKEDSKYINYFNWCTK